MSTAGNIPVYHQIGAMLEEKILSGEYPLGSRLPSERDIQQELDVTRKTIRRALELLEAKGIIAKRSRTLSEIVKLPAREARHLAFAFAGVQHCMYDIYQMFFAELKKLATLHLENLHYLDISQTIPREIERIQFDTVFLAGTATPELTKLLSPDTKMIGLDDYDVPGLDAIVCLDNFQAGIQAAEVLIRAGCRHPAFLGMEGQYAVNSPNWLRLGGFTAVLQKCGLQYHIIDIAIPPSIDNTLSALRQKLVPEIDGIFTINDYIGIMTTKALQMLQRKVPEELRLLSLDGQEMGNYTMPSLTTMAQPCEEIAAAAYELSRKAKAKLQPFRKIQKTARLIYRESLPEPTKPVLKYQRQSAELITN